MRRVFHRIRRLARRFLLIGIACFICCFFQVWLWMRVAEFQVVRFRLSFFTSLLRQHVGWFDSHKPGELT